MSDELLGEFVVESNEHMADIENQLLSIEESGADIDVDLINEVFRGIHSIKGAAGFLGLTTVNDLAHNLENILNMMRNEELTPTSPMIDTMLRAADQLQGLLNDVENSNDADVSEHIKELEAIANGDAPAEAAPAAASEPAAQEAAPEPGSDDAMDAAIEAAFAAQAAAKSSNQVAEPTPAPTPEPQPEPAPEKAPVAVAKKEGGEKKAAPEANIRVSVGVLDKLMNLAGELVLSRNQLMQAIGSADRSSLDSIASRLDQVTSEVQESIMQTRMQQIGSVFSKFPRIVRDLSGKLGKQCALNIEGKEVEVDKTIVEAIGDPLTHLIRNSVDHGIESPADRRKANKPEEGTMNLRACYQAGKVRIEIEDDGAGIDANKLKAKAVSKGILTQERADQMGDREAIRLIFHPGFSMAAKVTDVSGRGVGMDVVKTNIAKLGGIVDIESTVGEGTLIVITLPLTLAIIPSLIVQCQQDRFAIPQVNIAELVRVRAEELDHKIGTVQDAEVLRLRGNLLPLIRLSDVVEMTNKSDEPQAELNEDGEVVREAINIIVVETGEQRFGIIVDGLHDSEEIVVKPLSRHLQSCPCLSGATILGDGHVALILDVAGIAASEDIRCDEDLDASEQQESTTGEEDSQYMLLFSNHEKEHFAITMDIISRIDRIRADQIDSVGGQELLQYRNTTMPLLRLENCISAQTPETVDRLYVIVYEAGGNEVGLVVPRLDDIRDVTTVIDQVTFTERGVLGSMVLDERTTRLVDLFEIAEISYPDWFEDKKVVAEENDQPPLVLLAEDSGFFRKQVAAMIKDNGYRVVDCEDGQIAWDTLQSGEHEFDLVVTDIEMPNMNGFEFAERIKTSQWSHLPVIALTSLAGSADIQRGIEVGIDDYQIKMDRDKLLNSIGNFCGKKSGNNKPALQSC